MGAQTRARWARRTHGLVFYALLVAAVGLAGWLSLVHDLHWDWTASARNSLSEPSRQVLARLSGPLEIIAFAPPGGSLRKTLSEFVERYRRVRHDIHLRFVDPQTDPALSRKLHIQVSGELILQYQGRNAHLRQVTEQAFTDAVEGLAAQGERWVAYLTGHGERSLAGQANFDLGDFGAELTRKGFRLEALNLAAIAAIPRNTALLVLAGPRVDLLPGEWELIRRHIEAGQHLLWMTDPEAPIGAKAMKELLGVETLPGVVVDPNAAALGIGDPAIALVSSYPDHPATINLDRLSLFPHAAALESDPGVGWKAVPVLSTGERSWNETGPLKGTAERDPESGEREGPLVIGYALTRPREQGEQRVLLIGDGDFLSNAFLGNAGNLDLGLNLVRWASGRDRMLDIPAKTAPDLELALSRTATAVIGFGFLLVLPLALAGTGGLIWWRRRRR